MKYYSRQEGLSVRFETCKCVQHNFSCCKKGNISEGIATSLTMRNSFSQLGHRFFPIKIVLMEELTIKLMPPFGHAILGSFRTTPATVL